MTSLTEVYQGNKRQVASLRRLYAGAAMVLAGAALAIAGMLAGTTDVLAGLGYGTYEARQVAGVLGGIGVPLVLVGVFAVLPADRRVRATAVVGASVCVLGVVLFWFAYPHHWAGYGDDHTLLVSTVYALGLITSLWCLFTGVVTFKTRNDPGGMLRMNVTRKGETKVVQVEKPVGVGSMGVFGTSPDGEVETQTNSTSSRQTAHSDATRSKRAGSARTTTTGNSAPSGRARRTPASDGGSTTGPRSPLDDPAHDVVQVTDDAVVTTTRPAPRETADRYCGNCAYFEYARSGGGIQPYCERDERLMDDMDACDAWEPRG